MRRQIDRESKIPPALTLGSTCSAHQAIPPHRRGTVRRPRHCSRRRRRGRSPISRRQAGRRWPSPSSSPDQRATGSRQCEKRGKIVPGRRRATARPGAARRPAGIQHRAIPSRSGKNALAVNDSGEQGRHCEPNAGSAAAQAGVRWCARRQAAHREDFEPGNANIDESGNAGGRREWTPTGSAERRRRTRDHHDLEGRPRRDHEELVQPLKPTSPAAVDETRFACSRHSIYRSTQLSTQSRSELAEEEHRPQRLVLSKPSRGHETIWARARALDRQRVTPV